LNLLPTSRVACLGLLCGLILSSCGAADPPSLSEVKGFDAYRVYYDGEEIAGQPLSLVERGEVQNHPHSESWLFIYGDCDPPPTGESGCPPPLQIQNYSACYRWPSGFRNKPRSFDFRGAKATGNGTSIEDGVEISTGRTTVVIFSEQRKLAASAARELRDVRQAGPSRLPPPVPGSLSGKLPCQSKRG
jgi:hypothetical protein